MDVPQETQKAAPGDSGCPQFVQNRCCGWLFISLTPGDLHLHNTLAEVYHADIFVYSLFSQEYRIMAVIFETDITNKGADI